VCCRGGEAVVWGGMGKGGCWVGVGGMASKREIPRVMI